MTNETILKFNYPDSLIREYDHWVVLLRPAQVTIGSSLSRHSALLGPGAGGRPRLRGRALARSAGRNMDHGPVRGRPGRGAGADYGSLARLSRVGKTRAEDMLTGWSCLSVA